MLVQLFVGDTSIYSMGTIKNNSVEFDLIHNYSYFDEEKEDFFVVENEPWTKPGKYYIYIKIPAGFAYYTDGKSFNDLGINPLGLYTSIYEKLPLYDLKVKDDIIDYKNKFILNDIDARGES